MIVELDGYGHHRSRVAKNADIRRDEDHRRAGWDPRRFTYDQLHDDPRWVMETIAGALRLVDPETGADSGPSSNV